MRLLTKLLARFTVFKIGSLVFVAGFSHFGGDLMAQGFLTESEVQAEATVQLEIDPLRNQRVRIDQISISPELFDEITNVDDAVSVPQNFLIHFGYRLPNGKGVFTQGGLATLPENRARWLTDPNAPYRTYVFGHDVDRPPVVRSDSEVKLEGRIFN